MSDTNKWRKFPDCWVAVYGPSADRSAEIQIDGRPWDIPEAVEIAEWILRASAPHSDKALRLVIAIDHSDLVEEYLARWSQPHG